MMVRRNRRNPLRNLTPEQKERQTEASNADTRARMLVMGVAAYLKRNAQYADREDLKTAAGLILDASDHKHLSEEIRKTIRQEIKDREQVPEGGIQ